MSLQKDNLEKNPHVLYFLKILLKKSFHSSFWVTICHDLSWESRVSNLASKASHRLGILRRAKSFLGPPELLNTYKVFVCSLMEYCSLLWAGAPASHLSRIHAVETKAFRIIGISRDETESLGLSLPHHRHVGGLFIFYRLLADIAPLLCLRYVPTIFATVSIHLANQTLYMSIQTKLFTHID